MKDPKGNCYAPCIKENCSEMSAHKTGLCEKCRTHICICCGSQFISVRNLGKLKKKCSFCRRVKKD